MKEETDSNLKIELLNFQLTDEDQFRKVLLNKKLEYMMQAIELGIKMKSIDPVETAILIRSDSTGSLVKVSYPDCSNNTPYPTFLSYISLTSLENRAIQTLLAMHLIDIYGLESPIYQEYQFDQKTVLQNAYEKASDKQDIVKMECIQREAITYSDQIFYLAREFGQNRSEFFWNTSIEDKIQIEKLKSTYQEKLNSKKKYKVQKWNV